MSRLHRNSLWAVGAVLLLCGFASHAKAQVTYASIVGNVRDSSGAVMPNVPVTITNQNTGEQFKQPTNEAGAYAFTTLFPGVYKIHAEMPGFQAIDIENIQLQVTQTARFDFTMQVGAVSQKIEVSASAPVLATDKADIGNVVTNTQIQDLPLNGRDYMQLAALTNGVILGGTVEAGGPNFFSEGGRVTQNSFLVDGTETRVQREGGYGLNLSIDAIQEFKVMQNSFDAQYGRGTAIVNAVIKSGTNSFHGTAFEFVRNDILDAYGAFDKPPKPPLRQNQFGASLGGPIKRNKTWFFFDYEGQRIHAGHTAYTNVPTAAELQGNLAGTGTAIDPSTGQPYLNDQIPSSQFSTFAQAAIPYFSQTPPNSTALPNLNYVAVLTNPVTMNQYVTRIDQELSAKDRLSGHLIFFRYQYTNQGPLAYSSSGGYSRPMPNLEAQWTHSFSPSLLNVFYFGYSHTNTFIGSSQIASHNLTTAFGLQNLAPEADAYGVPQVNVTGYGSLGDIPWCPEGALDVARQFSDQFTYLKGRHTIGFGADLRILTYNDLGYATQNGYYNFTGAYTGNPFGDFLIGIPQWAYADQKNPADSYALPTENGEFSFYGQDSMRVTRNLTINAGLRWEIVQFPKENKNEFSTWNFQRGALDFAGQQLPDRIVPTQYTNFSPRLGIAYSPPFLEKTVFRAGSAIMYGNFRQWEVSLLHFNAPYIFDNFFFNNYPQPSFTTATLFPPVDTNLSTIDYPVVTLNYQNPDKRVPVTYEWNANIQRELMPNLMLEVGYVGNRGIYQPNRYDANQASLVPADELADPPSIQSRRLYQNVGFVSGNESNAWTSYNALNVRLERRFSNGFELLGVYTYSKTMGIWQHDNFTVPNAYNLRQMYGPVNDFPHVATISYIYTLPFGPGKKYLAGTHGAVGRLVGGWEINGITSFYAGEAMDFSTSVSNLLGNRGSNVPIRLANGNLPSGQRTTGRWFDTAAFIDPQTGVLGNTTPGAVWGPGTQNWDLSIFKNTLISEHKTIQFRCEMFNSFNHVNFSQPDTNSSDPTFGQISGAGAAREIQLGLKLLF